MNSGYFVKHQLLKLMNDAPESTYALQYIATSIFKFRQFELNYLEQMLESIAEKWNNQVLYFTTSMEIVK
jgi:hypothetical protein